MRVVKSAGSPFVGKEGGGSGGVGIPGTGANSEVHNSPADPDRVSAIGTNGFVANNGTVTVPNGAAFNNGWARDLVGLNAASSFAANGGQSGGYQTFAVNAGTAIGDSSAAFGSSISQGLFSFTAGRENTAHYGQFIIGQFAIDDNISNAGPTDGQFLFKIGYGSDDANRKDVFTVDDIGNTIGKSFSTLSGKPAGIKTGNSIYIMGNSICHYATSIYGTNRTLRSETNNQAVTVGTVRYPSYFSPKDFLPIKATVSVAGTTGANEPLWTGPGTQVIDGTVAWDITLDTAAYNGLPGYFNLGNAILKQALRPTFIIGAKSRTWEYIKTIADRQLATGDDPSIIWLMAPFENDCAAAATTTWGVTVWISAKEFLDRMIAAGRKIIIQGIHPASTYPAPYGPDCAAYLETQLSNWVQDQAGQAIYWEAPKHLYLSKVSGATYTPDTATAYLFSPGGAATATDGIHPYGVQHVCLALDWANVIGPWLNFNGVLFRDYSPDGPQRFPDPRILSTSGGTLGAGIIGPAVPADWSLARTGTATATFTIPARTDGVSGNLIRLDCTGGDGEVISASWKATKTLASLGMAVGDKIKLMVEIGGYDLSPLATIPSMDVTFVGATGGPLAVSAMTFSGFGNQMQGQALLSQNKLMVYALPWETTIPAGTTGLFVSIKLSGKTGAWTGKLIVGRTLLEKTP